jgi:cytochrome c oxidase subunit IV
MHRNHLLPCLAMLGAAVVVAVLWGVQLGTLAFIGVMLLCPLVMLVMLRGMAGHGGHEHHAPHEVDVRDGG